MVYLFRNNNCGYMFESEEVIIDFVRDNKEINRLLYSLLEFYRRNPLTLFLFYQDEFGGDLDYCVSTNPDYWEGVNIIKLPMIQRTE